jgi:hypothetical protein
MIFIAGTRIVGLLYDEKNEEAHPIFHCIKTAFIDEQHSFLR